MYFRDIIAIPSDINVKRTSAVCGQNVEFLGSWYAQ
jgi:hypothetical protein